MESTALIIEGCALIETRCGEIYRYFAKLHASEPAIEALWSKTADEEDNHALQFRMLGRLKGGGVTGVNADPARVSADLDKLEGLLRQLRRANPTPMQALQLAIKLETHLSQYHSSIVICGDENLQNLLKSMMSSDLEHVEMLEKALKKLQAADVQE